MKTDKNKIIKLYESIVLNCANETFYSVWNAFNFNGNSISKVIKDIGLKDIYSVSKMKVLNRSGGWSSYYVPTRNIRDKQTLGDYDKIVSSLNKSYLVRKFDKFVFEMIKRFFSSLSMYEAKCYKYFRFKSCDGVKRYILDTRVLNNYKSNKVSRKDLYSSTTSSFALYCFDALPKKTCIDYLKNKYENKNVPYNMCYKLSERFRMSYSDVRKIGFKVKDNETDIESMRNKINKGHYREAINDLEEYLSYYNKDEVNIYQVHDLIYSIVFEADKKDLLFLIGIMSEMSKHVQVEPILDLFNYKISQ